jgi:hypothetical protein
VWVPPQVVRPMLAVARFALCSTGSVLLTEHVMTKQKQQTPTAQAAQAAENRLDEALEESFPASDPIAVDMSEPGRSPVDDVPSAGKKPH